MTLGSNAVVSYSMTLGDNVIVFPPATRGSGTIGIWPTNWRCTKGNLLSKNLFRGDNYSPLFDARWV